LAEFTIIFGKYYFYYKYSILVLLNLWKACVAFALRDVTGVLFEWILEIIFAWKFICCQSKNVALLILVTKTQTCTVTYKIKQDIAIVFAGIISLYKTRKCTYIIPCQQFNCRP
jgi:hypothetical protein